MKSNPTTTGHAARLATFLAVQAVFSQTTHWNVIEAGAKGDGQADGTPLFQRLLDDGGKAGHGAHDQTGASQPGQSCRAIHWGPVRNPGSGIPGRVFVDKSVVESYANDRQAICRRIYPARPDSLGASLAAPGGAAHLVQAEVAAYCRATVNSRGEDSRKQLFVCDFPTLGSEEVI